MPLPYLPPELSLMVLEALVEDGGSLARYVTVSRQWQKAIEQQTFARIRVTPSRIRQLNAMTSRNRASVRYIWLCIELERYDCVKCGDPSGYTTLLTDVRDDALIKETLNDVFVALSSWVPKGRLALDISVHSTRDSEHWFKYLSIEPDSLPTFDSLRRELKQALIHRDNDRLHQWDILPTGLTPPMWAFDRLFAKIMVNNALDARDPVDPEEEEARWLKELPLVPAVTCVQIRLQTRRRWKPRSLAGMLCRMPRLREFHYEPWREWGDECQEDTDNCFVELLEALPRLDLRSLTIFENSNEKYTYAFQIENCSRLRPQNSALAQAFSKISHKFVSLSTSFIIEASDFFSREIEPPPTWPRLTTLVLTSRLLAPGQSYIDTMDMLEAAASAATRMPRLRTMEIWNGEPKLAAVFRYEFIDRHPSVITWKATWYLDLTHSVIKAWEVVTTRRSFYGLNVVYESLKNENIICHGNSVISLELAAPVVRPVSLLQIMIEHIFFS